MTGMHNSTFPRRRVRADLPRLTSAVRHCVPSMALGLSPMDRDDRDILAAEIDGHLLEELTVPAMAPQSKRPMSTLTSAVFSLIERDFAFPDRMRSAIAR